MEVEDEVKEYRKHTAEIRVDSNKVSITTLENIHIQAEFLQSGVFILSSSIPTPQTAFDDLGQLLSSLSPCYRDSFSQELIEKLSKFTE